MHTLEQWFHDPAAQAAAESLRDSAPVVETAIAIQQIAAPTFAEGLRGQFVQSQMQALGLREVAMDEVGNVYGCRLGTVSGPGLLIAAHLDTVFPAGTDLSVRREGERIYGPGLGDNSLGVAGLLHLARALQQHDVPNEHPIWFVANVGEEGLGDLRGMRAAVDRLASQIGAAIALEGGTHGHVIHEAIGVRRYRVSATAAGGHSWQDFGAPSAIHALVRLAARLTHLHIPEGARSSYNIGVIEGGSSVNTIAQHASLLLDLRSVSPAALEQLVGQVEQVIVDSQAAETDVHITLEVVGNRPAGRIARDHPLVQAVAAIHRKVGTVTEYDVASTDANIPLSRGIPAVCIGVGDGYNAHRLDEYIEARRIGTGMQALLWLALAASSSAVIP
jgi:acetylornithine deacetylase/succinyl-diaminopimelate desuccinylase-like protein